LKKPQIIPLISLMMPIIFVIGYFVVHKPLDAPAAMALMLAVWRVLCAGLLIFLAGGIGYRLFSSQVLHPLANLALQVSLGLGVLSLGILGVGSLIGLPAWLLWIGFPVLLVVFLKPGWRSLRQLGGLANLWAGSNRLERWLAALCACLIGLPLLTALAPPLAFDALVSHLVLPQAYLALEKVAYLPWQIMSGMPQGMEMLYTWMLSLGGGEAAAALGWAIGLVGMLGLLGYLQQRLNERAAWVGLSSLLASFSLVKLLGIAYMDTLPFLYGVATLIVIDAWAREGGWRWLMLSGSLAGLAIGSKYTAGVLALSSLAAIAWHLRRSPEGKLKSLLVFGLTTCLVAAPWLIKNLVTTGNPFYPFFFEAGEMTPIRLAVYQAVEPFGNWLDLFFLPVRATLIGNQSSGGYMFSSGPLLLGLGCLCGLAYRKQTEEGRHSLTTASMLAGSGLVVWAIANQLSGNLIQTRYYISLFPAFACLAALGDFGLSQSPTRVLRPKIILNALLMLVLGLNLVEIGLEQTRTNPGPVVLGLKSQEQYLADNLGWFQPAMQAIRDLPDENQVLLLYEPRSFYCQPNCEPDEIMDRWKVTRAQTTNPETLRKAWIDEGFTHLLLYKFGLDFLVDSGDPNHLETDRSTLLNFLETLPDPINFGGVYQLYSLVE
jgi:hypothetical protein